MDLINTRKMSVLMKYINILNNKLSFYFIPSVRYIKIESILFS